MLVVLAGSLIFSATSAVAQQDPYTTTSPTVLPTIIKSSTPTVAPTRLRPPTDNVLPFTGGDVTLFVILGAVVIVIGFMIVRSTRARKGGAAG